MTTTEPGNTPKPTPRPGPPRPGPKPSAVPHHPPAPPVAGVPAGYQPKSRMVAGILGILLGGLGVHNFYLGYNSKAVIQILVTLVTCGIGSIWGRIEGSLILVKNPSYLTDANGVPLVD